jgi:5-hydroxyisourate hydrolase-like protein (transthyretin family)
VALGACAALLLGPATLGSAAPLRPGHPPTSVEAASQKYYWKWSDGSQKTSRLFREKTYKTQAKLPHLVVTVQPASPAHFVYLQFKQKGKWVVENKGTTNKKGVLRLGLNPYCSNDTWCDGTYEYRLKVGSLYQTFRINYSEK